MEHQSVFPLALPILKFSYVTTTAGRTSPLSWTHISGGSDLVALFDQASIPDGDSTWIRESRVLKVLRGRDILEELDLDALAREAVTSSSSQIQISNAKAPIAVLVKSPCLAVRYPTRLNQIRRFQLKFSSDADYRKAISILSEIGCPITESAVGGYNPPQASRASLDASNWLQNAGSSSLGQAVSHVENQTLLPAVLPTPEPRQSTVGPSQTPYSPFPFKGSAMVHENNNMALRGSGSKISKERPSTAPVFPDPESLSQLLPPKRELPFAPQRKPQRRATKAGKSARPPKTAELRPQTHTGEMPVAGIAQSAMPSLNSNGVAVPVIPVPEIRASATSRPAALISPSHSSHGTHTVTPALSPCRPTHYQTPEQNGTSQNYADRANIKPLPVLNPTDLHYGTTPLSYHQPTTQQIPVQPTQEGNFTNTVRSTINPGSQLTVTTADLSSYLSSPPSERSKLVESWVCQQLESDEFLALCQDVEGVWKRIAFGI
ncbi:hypothetical protein LOZ58_003729 [Ophidiomyces ophidiicola]|nr:hypothetical protein LOZ58_003729 [Ophidiomyces ophidiicola]